MINELKKIYSETHILGNAILFLIVCGAGFIDFGYPKVSIVLGALAFVLGFNLHDCIDYGRRFHGYITLTAMENTPEGTSTLVPIYDKSIAAYRAEQWYVMLLLGGLIWFISPWSVLWGFIMWQFCVADFFFYLVLKEPLVKMHYFWLENWSVIAMVLRPVSLIKFVSMALLGLILPLIWMVINLIKG
jgi:hypothetical protein